MIHSPPAERTLIVMHPVGTPPDGYRECNGDSLAVVDFAWLFGKIGYAYGGAGASFNVPDFRGEFIRGWDHGRGVDAGRGIGTTQSDQNKQHNHGVNDPGHLHTIPSYAVAGQGGGTVGVTSGLQQTTADVTGVTIQNSGGTEARPRNMAQMFCIAWKP